MLATAALMFVGSLGLVSVTETWQVRRGRGLTVETRLVLALSAALVMVLAIQHGPVVTATPAQEARLEPGDDVVPIGRQADLEALRLRDD